MTEFRDVATADNCIFHLDKTINGGTTASANPAPVCGDEISILQINQHSFIFSSWVVIIHNKHFHPHLLSRSHPHHRHFRFFVAAHHPGLTYRKHSELLLAN